MLHWFQGIVLVAAVGMVPVAGADTAAVRPLGAMQQLQEIRAAIRRARAAGDFASYLENSRREYAFLNGSPHSLLGLMAAESAAGQPDDALASFDRFVRMGQSNEEVLSQKQFDAVRSTERYASIHAAMTANDTAVSTASKLFEFTDSSLVPEDIDYDPATQRFYITSMLKKAIITVGMHGGERVFANAPNGWPMLAIKVDSRHRLLWATEVALDGYIQSPRKDWGNSAIDEYDLDTGRLLHRLALRHTALGDMTLTPEGAVIVSDGEHGGVYRVDRVSRRIERLDDGGFISPQTPVALPDGAHVMVPDYLRGIGILDLKSRRIAWLAMAGKYALGGIDGLYLFGNTLIATQNGTSPEQVVRFDLDASLTRVVGESIIERATPTLGDPTHGVVIDERFYYIANSGWDSLDDQGNIMAGKKMSPGAIMVTELGNVASKPGER